ncbi:MAG: type III polyketide synthase [Candidatus Methylomirabilales bacterium]
MATAVPPSRYTQDEVLALCGYRDKRRRQFFSESQIHHRYLYLPPDFYPDETIDALNARFERASLDIGSLAIERCLTAAGLQPTDIDFVATTTCTGRLCPSLDTRFIRAFKMRSDIQRVHVGDTGCASALVAIQQAVNHVHAFPGHRALVAAVEVCSATYFLDEALDTAVANAIFSDGAGALVITDTLEGLEILGSQTLLRSEYLDYMGFTYPGGRPRILLSKEIRHLAAEMLQEMVGRLLHSHGLRQEHIRFWVLHSAGRRVLERAQELLGLHDDDLAPARTILKNYGNISSATVLFVLEETLRSGHPARGDLGVMAALGPGFAAEGVLLRC